MRSSTGSGANTSATSPFVENAVLPGLIRGEDAFYYRDETRRMNDWAECLVYRLEADRRFEQTCRRADFRLVGMEEPPRSAGGSR